MKPDQRFTSLPKRFWALVRLAGQECGYTAARQINVSDRKSVVDALTRLGLSPAALTAPLGKWHTHRDKASGILHLPA